MSGCQSAGQTWQTKTLSDLQPSQHASCMPSALRITHFSPCRACNCTQVLCKSSSEQAGWEAPSAHGAAVLEADLCRSAKAAPGTAGRRPPSVHPHRGRSGGRTPAELSSLRRRDRGCGKCPAEHHSLTDSSPSLTPAVPSCSCQASFLLAGDSS